MTLVEKLLQCDSQTEIFFAKIDPLMRRNVPYGWLSTDYERLAKHLNMSRKSCLAKLDLLRACGILANGKKGYYCPYLVKEWIRNSKK